MNEPEALHNLEHSLAGRCRYDNLAPSRRVVADGLHCSHGGSVRNARSYGWVRAPKLDEHERSVARVQACACGKYLCGLYKDDL